MSKVTPSTAWTLATCWPSTPPWIGKCFFSAFTSRRGRPEVMRAPSFRGRSRPAMTCVPFSCGGHFALGVVTGHGLTGRLGLERGGDVAAELRRHGAASSEGTTDDLLTQAWHQTGNLRQLASPTVAQ